MAELVKEDIPSNPVNVGLLGPGAVVSEAKGFPNTVQKPWLQRRL